MNHFVNLIADGEGLKTVQKVFVMFLFHMIFDHFVTVKGSYAQNGPKSKSLYLLAKINTAECDWLILANEIQAT